MILQALNHYYIRLAEDPNVEIAPFGLSRQKIAFCVTLNANGSLHSIDDLREQQGSRLVPKSVIVLGDAKPSGSGINPCFLWDNPAYMLGYKPEDDKPERTRASFEAFRRRHVEAEATLIDPEFSAVCTFLKSWDPAEAVGHQSLVDMGTGFGMFRIRATDHFVHEQPAIKRWWKEQLSADQSAAEVMTGECLVSGAVDVLARLHEPKIKGVQGAQTGGAAIVSFNADAFESYRKKQSFNAPIGQAAAFQYCTALNHLLRSGSPQRLQVGDATTVFWTERPTEAESEFPWFLEPTKEAEDESLKSKLHATLSRIRDGVYPRELGDPTTPFYALGLSPNAARISVRFWLESTLADMMAHLGQHFGDLQLTRSERDPEFPAVWQLIRETVRETKNLPPLLSGAVMRSVLTGGPYPSLLFTALIRRMRADREVRYLRVAAIKAHLNRNTRFQIDPLEKEINVGLDEDRPEVAYHLGRLFAELEKTQEDALPNINDTIKDRYFSAASATPGSVFPRLIRLSQHHLGKLGKPQRTFHERRIQTIAGNLSGFATHLNLRDQGLFAIGYYHQRQDIFTKKPKPESEETEN
jgi:CRISPR-associated protein Csd1